LNSPTDKTRKREGGGVGKIIFGEKKLKGDASRRERMAIVRELLVAHCGAML